MHRRLARTTTVALTAVGLAATPAALTIQTAHAVMFPQCPAVGLDTGCAALITINPGGSITIAFDTSQSTYDAAAGDDTLVGVQDNDGGSLTSLQLSAGAGHPIFGFDGDGLCAVTPHPAGCSFGPTGYEGPGTSFSGIDPSFTTGTVNFSPALQGCGGATAYFSLEDALSSASGLTGTSSVGVDGEAYGVGLQGLHFLGTTHVTTPTDYHLVPPTTVGPATVSAVHAQVALPNDASTTIATADILVGGHEIHATAITATAGHSGCAAGTGDTTLGTLSTDFGGTVLPHPLPNTVLVLPDGLGTVTLNEQIPLPGGGLIVNAIHVVAHAPMVANPVDVIIASAEAD